MITWALNRWGRFVGWLKTGTWCQHEDWTYWYMVDLGREKIRFCKRCGWMETTNHPWQGFLRWPR